MAKQYPKELRDEIVATFSEGGATQKQVATSYGISESSLKNWLNAAYKADGIKAGTVVDDKELRDAKKRIKALEQECEILRRAAIYLGKDILPK